MDERLVGINHLLQVNRLINIVGEDCIGIELAVHIGQLLCCGIGGCALLAIELHHLGAEDAAGKVATVGNEVYIHIE